MRVVDAPSSVDSCWLFALLGLLSCVLLPPEDGEYSADLAGFTGGCKAWDPTAPDVTPADVAARHNNYRVTVADEVMAQWKVSTLRVFNTSLRIPLAHLAHPGRGDCRHWFNPSPVLEHWATVLYNTIVPPDA